jgi:hypothetical protein
MGGSVHDDRWVSSGRWVAKLYGDWWLSLGRWWLSIEREMGDYFGEMGG